MFLPCFFRTQVTFYTDDVCTNVDRTEAIPSTCVAVAQYPANNQVAAQWYYGYVLLDQIVFFSPRTC